MNLELADGLSGSEIATTDLYRDDVIQSLISEGTTAADRLNSLMSTIKDVAATLAVRRDQLWLYINLCDQELGRLRQQVSVIGVDAQSLRHDEPRRAYGATQQELRMNTARLEARREEMRAAVAHISTMLLKTSPYANGTPVISHTTSTPAPVLDSSQGSAQLSGGPRATPAQAAGALELAMKIINRPKVHIPPPPAPPAVAAAMAHAGGLGGGIKLSTPTYHEGRGGAWPQTAW